VSWLDSNGDERLWGIDVDTAFTGAMLPSATAACAHIHQRCSQMLPHPVIYFFFSPAATSAPATVASWWSLLRMWQMRCLPRAIASLSTICTSPPPSPCFDLLLILHRRYHTNLASVQYNVFFNLCRLKGVHFDLRERCGSAFVLLDSFSGGTVRAWLRVFVCVN
jgi:hypothetical protein